MKILIIGANGTTATHVANRLIKSSHDPYAMIRNANQREKFDNLGIPSVIADLEYPIDHALKGCDAVIFAAGSGGHTGKDKTVLIDHLGAIRSMVSAQVNDVKRYIMLSSLNADISSTSGIAHYHKAKGHADNFLRETDLDYTIICPGALTNDPATEMVSVSTELGGKGTTSRENLAAALVACLDKDNTIGKSFSLLNGKTNLDEALNSV